MKKSISICMALVLMLSAIWQISFAASAETPAQNAIAGGENLIANGDFETDTTVPAYTLTQSKAAFANGSIKGQWFTGGNETFGKGAEIVTDGTGHAMQAGKWLTQQLVGVEKGHTYAVNFKVKGVEADESKLLCHVNRFNYASDKARIYSLYARSFEAGERADDVTEAPDNDPAYTYALYQNPVSTSSDRGMIIPTAEWKTYSFTFTMSENVPENTAVLLQFWLYKGSKVLLDDVSVEDRGVAFLNNGNFDDAVDPLGYSSVADIRTAFANGSLYSNWFVESVGRNTDRTVDSKVVKDNGNYVLSMSKWASQAVSGLQAGHTYVVSFKAKYSGAPTKNNAQLRAHISKYDYANTNGDTYRLLARGDSVGVRADDVGDVDSNKSYIYALYTEKRTDGKTYASTKLGQDWKTYSFAVTVKDDVTATEALIMQFEYRNGDGSAALIDDVTIQEALENNLEVQDLFDFQGMSIRATGNQALRYKFNVSKSVLEQSAYKGYTVAEYGFVAQLSNQNSSVLTKESANSIAKPAYKCDGSLDNVFAETGDTKTVTAALYNIGYNKTTEETNYDYYSKDFAVRPYAVLTAGDYTVTVYGEVAEGSVFEVMKAILASTNTDEQTLADQAAVNQVLETAAVQEAYEAWNNAAQ